MPLLNDPTGAFIGTTGNDTFALSTNGTHAELRFNGAAPVDLGVAASVTIKPLEGADSVLINDPRGTALRTINVDLSGGDGLPDGQADTVVLQYSNNASEVFVTTGADGTSLQIDNFYPGRTDTTNVLRLGTGDTVTINGGSWIDDLFVRPSSAPHLATLVFNAGAGADLLGGAGRGDLFFGGDDGDVLTGTADGAASDTFDGGAGLDWGSVTNGLGNGNLVVVSANGRFADVTFDGAAASHFVNVENLILQPLGGADVVQLNDLSGTDVRGIHLDVGIWHQGADLDADVVVFNGAGTSDQVTATVADNGGAQVQDIVGGIVEQTEVVGLGAGDEVDFNLGAGNDTITLVRSSVAPVTVVANGGAGDDVLNGSAIADRLNGDGGLDTLSGGGGADTLDGGAGDDRIIWNLGDGADKVDGGAETDTAVIAASAAADIIALSANADHAALSGLATLDFDNVEAITVKALAGVDTIQVGHLGATEVRTVNLDLSGLNGLADGQADAIVLTGAVSADQVNVTLGADGSSLQISDAAGGVVETTNVSALDAADQVNVGGGAGDDSLSISGPASTAKVSLSGGVGNDSLVGSAGAEGLNGDADNDTLTGGGGADTINGGAGNDQIVWNNGDGADKVDGGADLDSLVVTTGAAADTIALSVAAAGHVSASLNGAVSDIDNVETISLRAREGADTIQVADFTATDVKTLNIDLAGSNGLADGQADTVILGAGGSGTTFTRAILATGGSSLQVTVTLPSPGTIAGTTNVSGLDTSDQLIFNFGGLRDILDIFGPVSKAHITINGGAGDDGLAGSLGDDTINGDADNDQVSAGGGGNDLLNGGSGNDRVLGALGNDTVNGDAGNDTVTGNGGFDVVNGGTGNDNVQGNFGAETLSGGADNDTITSNGGRGLISGDDGDDQVLWTFRDPGITIDGGLGADTLIYLHGFGPDSTTLSANAAGHLIVSTFTTLDVDNVETINITTESGADTIRINDLSTTDLRTVNIDLSESTTLPPGDPDTVILTGAASSDQVTVTLTSASSLTSADTVNGVVETVKIQVLGVNDSVTFDLGGGADSIAFAGGPSNARITVDGGAGNDSIAGGAGVQIIMGGDGDDTLSSGGGAGTEFVFSATQTGQDLITNFHLHANGGGDLIKLVGYADQSFADLVAHGHLLQSGADVVVLDGIGKIVTLQSTLLSDVSVLDFDLPGGGINPLPDVF